MNIDFEGEETLGNEYQDDASEGNQSVYPDAVVNIAKEPFSAFQLKRKYDKTPPLLVLDPDFQRSDVWKPKQKSELIESILMGIPLPLIYVKEDENGAYIIVDGRQRLTALFDFMNDKYCLQHLGILKDINGKFFSGLSESQRNKIEDCSLTLHIIKPPTSDRVMFDLFDRVNRGGTRLNNQEMRNALYQGPATKLLKELSESDDFKNATDNSLKPERMKDRYLILRFIAFYLWRKGLLVDVQTRTKDRVEYKSDLEDFLGKAMIFLNDEENAPIVEMLKSVFYDTMAKCASVFGKDCFRLPHKPGSPRRPVNMALFESLSYYVAETISMNLRSIDLAESLQKLLNDENYYKSLTYTVDSNISVGPRFEIIDKELRKYNND